jgi:hypothetical protein
MADGLEITFQGMEKFEASMVELAGSVDVSALEMRE